MNHWLIAPVLLPLFVGALLVCFGSQPRLARGFSLLSTVALLPIAIYLLGLAATGEIHTYALGNWQSPFGIVLLLDRLSALMLLTTAVLAIFAVLYALRGEDQQGLYFHALFQFQLAGINGAFLTGDLFNLFVFFEILLIASYGLLLHGRTQARVKAAMHYILLNLVGSAFFLIAAGIFYGIAGTLNMVDLARAVSQAQGDQRLLLHAAGLLLFLVFGLKAAFLPLYFWLPKSYASAAASVAALFAIMTKVGLYAIIRFSVLVFGSLAGESAGLGLSWFWPLALLTIFLGALGAFAATNLASMVAYFILVSVGTILAGIALGTPQALGATLYYLVHSTWVSGGLFLLVGVIASQRGKLVDQLTRGPALNRHSLIGVLFFAGAISIAGLPPLSGFFGKIMLLFSATGWQAGLLWGVILSAGLIGVVALSRAGSQVFWRSNAPAREDIHLDTASLVIASGLIVLSPVLVVFAEPVSQFTQATANQLFDVIAYLSLLNGGVN